MYAPKAFNRTLFNLDSADQVTTNVTKSAPVPIAGAPAFWPNISSLAAKMSTYKLMVVVVAVSA